MYKEKLIEQIKMLEERQRDCESFDVDTLAQLGDRILNLANLLDEYEMTAEVRIVLDDEEITARVMSRKPITKVYNCRHVFEPLNTD